MEILYYILPPVVGAVLGVLVGLPALRKWKKKLKEAEEESKKLKF